MSNDIVIESGLQFITSLINRPSLQDLDNNLFFNKLENTDVVEIRGTISSGVTALLAKLIAKCILPTSYRGLNIDVLFINTENQLTITQLCNFMHGQISEPNCVDEVVKQALSNLKIFNCYSHNQYFLTLNSLDNLLLKNKKISLIVVDSVSAYYWQQKDDLSYNSYLMKSLSIIRKISVDFKVVTLYTKQFNFESKKQTAEWFEGMKFLRYEVCLTRNEISNQLYCSIRSGKDKKELSYKIDETGFSWIDCGRKK